MTTTTPVEPAIVYRPAQPYVAVERSVTMRTMNEIADRIPEVIGWLGARGIPLAGAPFLRFTFIDMARHLRVQAGVPVSAEVPGEGDLIRAVLPAGRYLTLTHTGHPDRLVDVIAALLAWSERRGLAFEVTDTGEGQRWGCRLEIYHTNPAIEPDPHRWRTELAFRLASEPRDLPGDAADATPRDVPRDVPDGHTATT